MHNYDSLVKRHHEYDINHTLLAPMPLSTAPSQATDQGAELIYPMPLSQFLSEG
jgi:hypothetical protein